MRSNVSNRKFCLFKILLTCLLKMNLEKIIIREYIEKTYRLIHEVMENKWSHVRPEHKEKELNKR